MASMNIFTGSAFNTLSITSAFERTPFQPDLLGSMGIFAAKPSRTRVVAVERRNGFLSLVPTSPIGAPPSERDTAKRDLRDFRTPRLARSFTMYAEELNGVRAFGSETELSQVQAEVLRRGNEVRADMEMTHENMRLGAIQGIVKDADNSVIYDFFAEFGIPQPTVVNFQLGTTTTKVKLKCHAVRRAMIKAGNGAFTPSTTVHAVAGDTFYDNLITHPEVEKTFLNWTAAADLRANGEYQAFTYGGITWHNYRGTDDGSTVGVGTNDARFFPVGGRDVFQVAYGPAEFEPWVNAPGQEMYALSIPDRDRQAWNRFELYSYPLYMCTRPEMLQSAVQN